MKKVEVVLKRRRPFDGDVVEVKVPAYEFGVLGLVVARDIHLNGCDYWPRDSWMVVHVQSGTSVAKDMKTRKEAIEMGEKLSQTFIDWMKSGGEITANPLWVEEAYSVIRGGGDGICNTRTD